MNAMERTNHPGGPVRSCSTLVPVVIVDTVDMLIEYCKAQLQVGGLQPDDVYLSVCLLHVQNVQQLHEQLENLIENPPHRVDFYNHFYVQDATMRISMLLLLQRFVAHLPK